MTSPKEALQFAKKLFSKYKSKLEGEYLLEHSRFVIIAFKDLIKTKKTNVNLKDIEVAGFLHDIGYCFEDKTHAQKSLEIAEKKFKLNEIIKDCISNHSTEANPETKEGKIFQLADKLAFFYPAFIKRLIDLELKEGNHLNKIILKIEEKMRKYVTLFTDKEYQQIAKRYLNLFLKDKNEIFIKYSQKLSDLQKAY